MSAFPEPYIIAQRQTQYQNIAMIIYWRTSGIFAQQIYIDERDLTQWNGSKQQKDNKHLYLY